MPSSFYDFGAVMSRNGVYNFVVGARGLGKTYGAKQRAIRAWIKRGEEFIYLRRYQTEVKGVKQSFMADIAHEFPGWEWQVMGDALCGRMTGEKKWRPMCYFVALSKGQQKKSVSYHSVKTIIFDEFIIERGLVHYMPDEARVFNDFYSTVDRYKDKTRVFFLANSVSIMNPYFIQWGIEPHPDREWITKADGFIVAHFPDSEAFTAEVFETRFGKFIQGTDYAGYAVSNAFSDNHGALIAKKTENAQYRATIETRDGTFTVWVDNRTEGMPAFYIQAKRPKQEVVYTMDPTRVRNGVFLIEYSDHLLQVLRAGYSRARVCFDRPQTRNAFQGIYRRS